MSSLIGVPLPWPNGDCPFLDLKVRLWVHPTARVFFGCGDGLGDGASTEVAILVSPYGSVFNVDSRPRIGIASWATLVIISTLNLLVT
jgi:hypothetical protein